MTVAAGIAAALLAALGAFVVTQYGVDSMPDLSARGVATSGRVLRPLPDQHNQVLYAYSVNGLTYQAQNFSEAPNPPASRLRPGDNLYVTYDPQKPQVSCACAPKLIIEGAQYVWIPITSAAAGAFVLVTVLSAGAKLAQAQRRTSKSILRSH